MNIQKIEEFEAYLEREVASASSELENLEEESRKHLQKLVYTNLVDRFDSMVDHTLLDNAFNETLLTEVLDKLKEPISEGEILRLFVDATDTSGHINSRVQDTLRNGVLRNRHSKKLSKLLEVFCPDEHTMKPRVNVSTGKILSKFKPQNNKIPSSIAGYADWLYSRRNAVVHGGGSASMLDNDLEQLKTIYKANPAKRVRLSLSSLKNATAFYSSVVRLLKDAK